MKSEHILSIREFLATMQMTVTHKAHNVSMNETKEVRVRIAPSPTGYPHIGTLYQALFNYAYAKKHGGKFLVRIEDTDRSRFVEGAEDVIFSSIDWAGLTEDESPRNDKGYGPYRQSERLSIYHKYVQELLDQDKAFFAYYPKAEAGVKKDYSQDRSANGVSTTLDRPNPPASVADMPENGDWIIRMRVPQDTSITFRDEIRGDITFESKQVTEQVLLKSDKYPTYHLAVVVDDHLMGITHVVRGEEWISSTPKHVLLYDYFGWEKPLFFHTPDLRNPDKSKLSKRQGHTNVNWYREEGYLPEAMVNYLALLGWTHPEEKEIFTLSEFIEKFDLKDIRAVGPVFDLAKFTWMSQHYIMNLSANDLKTRLKNHLPWLNDTDDTIMDTVLPLVQTRMEKLKDYETLAKHFYTEPHILPRDEKEKEIAKDLRDGLSNVVTWHKDEIFPVFKTVMQKHTIRMPVLYYLLTGSERGLPLPESIEILGKEKTLQRLSKLL